MDYKAYIKERQTLEYERDRFDKFLKKSSFSYNLPSIHIAGTNGKGQTANYLASIYMAAGYKVALYTSPYYESAIETIRINNLPMEESVFNSYIDKYLKLFNKYNLSAFEIETFIALNYFIDNKVDIAVIECGMGGIIDATNCFTPILSIITSIAMEHTSVLGRTLSEIAEHKSGIIKERVPVLIGDFLEEPRDVISKNAKEMEAPICMVSLPSFEKVDESGYTFTYGELNDLHIKSKSLFSVKDACYAIEGVSILKEKFPVSKEAIYEGILKASLTGRMEFIKNHPNVLVDGAHNPEAIDGLVKDVEKIRNNRHVRIVFACFKDKNMHNMLSSLNLLTNDLVITTFDHPRCRTIDEYFLFMEEYKCEEDHISLINEMIKEYPDDLILITGSLAFAYKVVDEFKKGILG